MEDWGPTYQVVKLIAWLLSGFAIVVWIVISTVRSIQEHPYGPAAESASKTNSDETTLRESQADDPESPLAETDSDASLDP